MSKPQPPHQPQRDPLSPLARDVLSLFAEELAEVRFPDLDRACLEAGRDALCEAQLDVERIESELDAARALVTTRGEALTLKAQRALAYARVFAEANPELALRVAALSDAKASPSARGHEPKKRGRPRKGDGDANLFGAVEGTTFESVEVAAE